MLVFLNGIKHIVSWKHEPDYYSKLIRHDGSDVFVNGRTMCYIKLYDTKEIIQSAIAVCIKPDIYNPSIGRKESLYNLIASFKKKEAEAIKKVFYKEIVKNLKINVPSHMTYGLRKMVESCIKHVKLYNNGNCDCYYEL